MENREINPIEALIVAVPETAGSALYGMIDVLSAAGNLWQQLVGTEPERRLIRPRIMPTSSEPFQCGNGIPVIPHMEVKTDPGTDVVILPELWLSPDEDMKGRYPKLMKWSCRRYQAGAAIYSACSGAAQVSRRASTAECFSRLHLN